ncbi:hypothetical protein FRC05_005949 [Tulasnella sp. 425]|nr:hypothetical protein FRC05_005949 [Tulasnella sp. 425]
MMNKVLDDVLDLRVATAWPPDGSSRFPSRTRSIKSSRAFSYLHDWQLELADKNWSRNLILKSTSLARTALYRAKGMSEERIAQLLQDGDDEDAGLIVGDEHRLRQVITNLASAVEDGTTAVGDSSPTPIKPRTDEDDDDDCPPLGNDDDDFENRDPRASHDIEAPPLTGE